MPSRVNRRYRPAPVFQTLPIERQDATRHFPGLGILPNVVDARRPTFAGGAIDTCCSSDFLKQRDHMWIRPSSARLRCKETGIIAQRQWKLPPPLNMDGQLSCEFWSDRHKPCLEKLCVAKR
jgi:hypothetical protein